MPQDLLLHPNTQRLAIAPLHFLWQGTLLAALYGIVVALLVHRPRQRYIAGIATLAAMAICLPVTYSLVEPSAVQIASAQATNDATNVVTPENAALAELLVQQSLQFSPTALPDARMQTEISPEAAIGRAPTGLDRWYGVMVLTWLSGTLVCGLRLLAGAIALDRLTRRTTPASAAHLRLVERLGGTIGLRRLPRLLVSTRVSEAIATGFFRPVIVFPAAWLSELPPAVIEAVLAHESCGTFAATIYGSISCRRAVEAVLFFHPAVWWVSRQVRSDREMCCDALAVAATGKKVSYVRAL